MKKIPRVIAAILAAMLPAGVGGLVAQTGLGADAEFQVNTHTTSYQVFSSVAADDAGNFVVVWESYGQDGSAWGIFGQLYDNAGAPQGAEFQVNTFTTGYQGSYTFRQRPGVAMDADGDFVVVWDSFQDGSARGVFGQRFDSAGMAQGVEFSVNTYTTSDQMEASVAMDASGGFVVVWTSFGQDGDSFGIFGQLFDATGAKVGGEFLADTATVGASFRSSVGMDGDGDFVVVWTDDADAGLRGRRFDSDAVAQGSQFVAGSDGSGSDYPSASLDADGDFVVAWEQRTVGPSNDAGIFAQRRNSSGVLQGSDFQVSTYTTYNKLKPTVSLDADGDFVVVWQSYYQEGGPGAERSWGIFARRYDGAGNPVSPEFQVNTYTTGPQLYPGVAADADGDFVVTWSSTHDGSYFGVFARRYSQGACTALGVTAPVAAIACEFRSATFEAVADGGGVPHAYQWRKDGVDLAERGNRAGTDRSVLTVDPVFLDDAGSYDVEVTDACSTPQTVTSTAATLTVTPAPDDVGDSLRVTTDGVNLTFTWTDLAEADDYVVREDTAPDGSFAAETGTAPSGTPGLAVPLPPGTTFYHVAGRTAGCEGSFTCGDGAVDAGGEECDDGNQVNGDGCDIDCTFSRYTDNGNGTVTDKLTGLVWLKNADCFGQRSWSDATADAAALADGLCGLTDGSLALDWRLPTKAEWDTAVAAAVALGCTVVPGEGDPPSITNMLGTGCHVDGPQAFTDVVLHYYWASTQVVGVRAFRVYLLTGETDFTSKGAILSVWPVRAGP